MPRPPPPHETPNQGSLAAAGSLPDNAELCSVHRLAEELAAQGVMAKQRITAAGKQRGGQRIGRGALFHLLRNQLYLGKITHKGAVHEGEHDAIVDPAIFARVQQALAARPRRRAGTDRSVHPTALTGRIFDASGEIMSPTSSRGRSGRIYRYYVSASLQQGNARPSKSATLQRVPAPAIESLVRELLDRLLPNTAAALSLVQKVRLGDRLIEIDVSISAAKIVRANLADGEDLEASRNGCTITVPLALPLRGGRSSITAGTRNRQAPDPVLVGALRKAHKMLARDPSGLPTLVAAPSSPYERSVLRLALLAPDMQRDILAGRHPRQLNLETLLNQHLPLGWPEQRRVLGFCG